ncbi:MAG: proton-conducting transporter membrane subunit [Anaerolineae bacterium]
MDMALLFNDPNFLPWLVPVGPLVAFIIITFATNRARLIPATSHEYGGHHPDYGGMEVPVVTPLSRVLSVTVGISGVVMALLISLNIVGQALGVKHFGEEIVFASAIEWLATGTTAFRMGVMVDPLNALLLVMVPIAVLCIFIYSIGYMAHDPRQSRFFALISLFAAAMLTLTVADNLLLLFVGWEVMGLCSYMLIGFWFEKHSAYRAAIKAFTVTRVADVIMLLGIAYLYAMTGTLNFRDIMQDPALLNAINTAPAILFGSLGISAGGLIGSFLIIGTIGKSAQFPLHVWLPDAMEGPTPVSAMIHAAAMVSAGIYAVLRMFPLFVGAGDPVGGVANPHIGVYNLPLVLLAVVGAFTALFAATMAVAQNDVKGVLAYSTISQLGFMMAALGIGAYVAAAFHLITHAFFKALLFMASGSVIHAMEHGAHHLHAHGHDHEPEPEPATRPYYETAQAADAHHEAAHTAHDDHHAHDHGHHEEHGHGHAFDPQDMRNMGGLAKKIPVTFVGFVIGGLALAGFPLITSGFWSKDEILAEAWYGTLKGYGPQALVFFLLATAAFLTAFYTMRQICLTFLGEPRTEEAKHASLGGPRSIVSITMQLPLIILSFFALFAGFVGVPEYFPVFGPIFSPEGNPLFHFLEYSVLPEPNFAPFHPPFNPFPVLVSFAVALGGLYLGWRMYGRKPLQAGEMDPMERILGSAVYTTLQKRYYMDDLYSVLFVKPSQWIARQVNTFLDRGVIDGTLHAIGAFFTWLGDLIKMLNSWLIDGVGDGIPRWIYTVGGWLRGTQSGRIQQYLLAVLIAFLIIGIVLAVSSGVVTAG